jgi:hypothetical protein
LNHHIVRTIEHVPWKDPSYRIPRQLIPIELDMICEREDLGLIEQTWGPYRNSSFFIPKKNGKYRFIISCTSANKITLEDVGLPPNVEEFAESFADFPIITLIDFYSGYEQIILDE